jgi:antitoxin component YwqK of YwqJK toxin-antitoxin module
MYRQFLIITVLLTALSASGQDKMIDGLKTGYWTEYSSGSDDFFKQKGNYKILSTASYDKILEETAWNVKVKYKGATPLVWFIKNVNGRISVKDSIWNKYDIEGRLRETSFWKDGLSQWAKIYDEKGNLVEHNYEDFDNDTSFKLIYIDGKLFKRAFYPPFNKQNAISVYYPSEPLSFSNAEFWLEIDFLNNPTVTKEFSNNVTKDMTIKSISSIHRFVKLVTENNQPLSFPYNIKAGTAVPLKIIVSPTSADYQETDTLTLITAESELPYRICLHISASHIGRGSGQEFSLSKSKDKYLILPMRGTLLAAELTSEEGKKTKYLVSRTFKRIDLSTFSVGKYGLQIRACHYNGDYTLVVTE